jgi:hypothetical protein
MSLKKKAVRWITIGAILVSILIAVVLLKDFIILPIAKPVSKTVPTIEYGIVTDSFSVIRDEVKSGQTFSSLLSNFNVGSSQLGLFDEKAGKIFDFRKFRAGNEYTAMVTTTAPGSSSILCTKFRIRIMWFSIQGFIACSLRLTHDVVHRLQSHPASLNHRSGLPSKNQMQIRTLQWLWHRSISGQSTSMRFKG